MDRLALLPHLGEQLCASAAPVIVTGAGGWLGQAALEMLDTVLGDALAGQVTVFASTERVVTLRSGRSLSTRAFSALDHEAAPPSFILHCGFLTRGHAARPDYVAVNREITARLHGFIERNGARGIFIPSSGAVYAPGGLAGNPYGVLKAEDEVIFGALAARLGFPAAIIRIFNLAGPLMNNLTGYALASIVTDAARGGPITLRAAHPVWRSYTHVADVLNIAMAALLGGLELGIFDTAGECALELGALADRVSEVVAGGRLPILRPDWRDGAPDRYLGDRAAYEHAAAQAGVGLQSLERQIRDTAAYLAAGP
jgi:nucleoside-diphosphate-sugar epimerase